VPPGFVWRHPSAKVVIDVQLNVGLDLVLRIVVMGQPTQERA
jgi:hypothetical protein